jgi:L-ascorbate metabolism protein UlaG (beta-lactamase superfamily)
VKGPGDADSGVRVRWFGHSCFGLEDSAGRYLLIDPFDETVGYDLAWVEPDAVLVTHDHFDHSYLRRAVHFDLVNSSGVHTVAGVEVSGVPAFHDDDSGRVHGPTLLFVWEMGGLKFAHLGDLGQRALDDAQREALRGVDVLFVPIGGRTTLDAAAAAAVVREVAPRVAVPMHYATPQVRFFEFDGPDAFLGLFPDVWRLPEPEFQVRRSDLPAQTVIFVPTAPERRR